MAEGLRALEGIALRWGHTVAVKTTAAAGSIPTSFLTNHSAIKSVIKQLAAKTSAGLWGVEIEVRSLHPRIQTCAPGASV